MPKHIESSTWKSKATDVVYKDPFSDTTTKIRKKMIFFSSLILLNHFFPIELTESPILGLHFSDGVAPSIAGLIGIIVFYFASMLLIYTYQEIKAWLAQANELEFSNYQRSLHDIYAHNQSIHTAVGGATKQIEKHTSTILELKNIIKEDAKVESNKLENNLNAMEAEKQSFENFCRNLGDSNVKFEEEIKNAQKLFKQTASAYKAAMLTQAVKVGVLEILLPFLLAAWSIYLASQGISQVLNVIFS